MAQVAQVDPRAMRGQLAWIILPVNLLAAVVVFTYFRFVDYATVEIAHVPLAGELGLFPEGGLAGVGGVSRLGVRARLLAIFFLVGGIPVFVLGMAAYRGASTALAGGPEADSVMLRMLAIVAFLVLATIVVSAGLD